MKDTWTIELTPMQWSRLFESLRRKTVTDYELANEIVDQIKNQMKGNK